MDFKTDRCEIGSYREGPFTPVRDAGRGRRRKDRVECLIPLWASEVCLQKYCSKNYWGGGGRDGEGFEIWNFPLLTPYLASTVLIVRRCNIQM